LDTHWPTRATNRARSLQIRCSSRRSGLLIVSFSQFTRGASLRGFLLELGLLGRGRCGLDGLSLCGVEARRDRPRRRGPGVLCGHIRLL
jgi:hypothetical protein